MLWARSGYKRDRTKVVDPVVIGILGLVVLFNKDQKCKAYNFRDQFCSYSKVSSKDLSCYFLIHEGYMLTFLENSSKNYFCQHSETAGTNIAKFSNFDQGPIMQHDESLRTSMNIVSFL